MKWGIWVLVLLLAIPAMATSQEERIEELTKWFLTELTRLGIRVDILQDDLELLLENADQGVWDELEALREANAELEGQVYDLLDLLSMAPQYYYTWGLEVGFAVNRGEPSLHQEWYLSAAGDIPHGGWMLGELLVRSQAYWLDPRQEIEWDAFWLVEREGNQVYAKLAGDHQNWGGFLHYHQDFFPFWLHTELGFSGGSERGYAGEVGAGLGPLYLLVRQTTPGFWSIWDQTRPGSAVYMGVGEGKNRAHIIYLVQERAIAIEGGIGGPALRLEGDWARDAWSLSLSSWIVRYLRITGEIGSQGWLGGVEVEIPLNIRREIPPAIWASGSYGSEGLGVGCGIRIIF